MEEELRQLNLERLKKINSKKLNELISRLNQEEQEEQEEYPNTNTTTPSNTPFLDFNLVSDEERSPPEIEEIMNSIDFPASPTATGDFSTVACSSNACPPPDQSLFPIQPIPHVLTEPVSPPPPTPSPSKRRKISCFVPRKGIGRGKNMNAYKDSVDKQQQKEEDEKDESTSNSDNEANEEDDDDIVKPKYRVKIEFWKKNRQTGCYEKHSNKTIPYLSSSRDNIRVFNKKQFDNLCLIHNERKLYLNYLDQKQEELLMQIKKQNKTKEKKLQK